MQKSNAFSVQSEPVRGGKFNRLEDFASIE
jgi:hypothetical protein